MAKLLGRGLGLFLLVSFVMFSLSVAALEVTTINCDNPAFLTNGSLICIDCPAETVFNEATGDCDLIEFGSSGEVKAAFSDHFTFFGGKLVPENPSLGYFFVVGIFFLIVWRLITMFK